MKILMISSYLPYPLFSGGQVRLYNLIKELSAQHEVTLLCEKRQNQTSEDISEIKKICKDVVTVERKKQWSISTVIRAAFSSHSFLRTGHTNPDFKQKIQHALNQNSFDVIHVETYYVMQNVPPTDLPIVLVDHNIEYQVYEKFMQRAPVFLRPLLKIDISKIRNEEEIFWKQANALVAVSREDQTVMKKAGCDPFLVSNGVNTIQFKFKEKSLDKLRTKKVLFLGDFRWIQNKDAVTYLIKDIWPHLKKSGDIKLWIVGRKIPDAIMNLITDPGVSFDEESSSMSTEEIFHEAAVLLAPIRVGGGTSYKILEAMSSGTPVVTMQMSADALGAKDGQDVLVGKTAQELAEKTIQVLKNDSLYKKISTNGRALVEENYTWKEIGKKLEEVYNSVVQSR